MPNAVSIGQTVAEIYGHFSLFQNGGRPPCLIFKSLKFEVPDLFGGSTWANMHNRGKCCADRSNRWRDGAIF